MDMFPPVESLSPQDRRLYFSERLALHVSERVMELLAERGLSEAGLAERCGFGLKPLMKMLCGDRDITVRELAIIADALAVTPGELIADIPSPEAPGGGSR